MKSFIVHNKQGNILRTGLCQDIDFKHQARKSEFIMEGTANDVTQKVVGRGKLRRVVDKTPEEMQAEKSPEISFEKRAANINNEQWQDVLDRLDKLDNRSTKIGG